MKNLIKVNSYTFNHYDKLLQLQIIGQPLDHHGELTEQEKRFAFILNEKKDREYLNTWLKRQISVKCAMPKTYGQAMKAIRGNIITAPAERWEK